MLYSVPVVGLRANKLLFIVIFNPLTSTRIMAELRNGVAKVSHEL